MTDLTHRQLIDAGSHISWVLVVVSTDDHRVGGEVREVEGEGVGALAQLLDQPGLQLRLLGRRLYRGQYLHET